MILTTLSSHELGQDIGRAREVARLGPVLITDEGQPTHVLISIGEYQRLTRQRRNIADVLAMPDIDDIDIESERIRIDQRPIDLS